MATRVAAGLAASLLHMAAGLAGAGLLGVTTRVTAGLAATALHNA